MKWLEKQLDLLVCISLYLLDKGKSGAHMLEWRKPVFSGKENQALESNKVGKEGSVYVLSYKSLGLGRLSYNPLTGPCDIKITPWPRLHRNNIH